MTFRNQLEGFEHISFLLHKLHYDFSLIRIQLPYAKRLAHMTKNHIYSKSAILSRVIFLISNTSLPKVGKRLLIGLQPTNRQKWLFVSADVRGAGTRDEHLRMSTWDTMYFLDTKFFIIFFFIMSSHAFTVLYYCN